MQQTRARRQLSCVSSHHSHRHYYIPRLCCSDCALFCPPPFSPRLHAILNHTTPQNTAPHYTAPHYTTPHYTALHHTQPYDDTPHETTHYTAPHHAVLHGTTSHGTTLHHHTHYTASTGVFSERHPAAFQTAAPSGRRGRGGVRSGHAVPRSRLLLLPGPLARPGERRRRRPDPSRGAAEFRPPVRHRCRPGRHPARSRNGDGGIGAPNQRR